MDYVHSVLVEFKLPRRSKTCDFQNNLICKKKTSPDHKLQPDAITVTGDQQSHSILSQLISCVLRNGNQ